MGDAFWGGKCLLENRNGISLRCCFPKYEDERPETCVTGFPCGEKTELVDYCLYEEQTQPKDVSNCESLLCVKGI